MNLESGTPSPLKKQRKNFWRASAHLSKLDHLFNLIEELERAEMEGLSAAELEAENNSMAYQSIAYQVRPSQRKSKTPMQWPPQSNRPSASYHPRDSFLLKTSSENTSRRYQEISQKFSPAFKDGKGTESELSGYSEEEQSRSGLVLTNSKIEEGDNQTNAELNTNDDKVSKEEKKAVRLRFSSSLTPPKKSIYLLNSQNAKKKTNERMKSMASPRKIIKQLKDKKEDTKDEKIVRGRSKSEIAQSSTIVTDKKIKKRRENA